MTVILEIFQLISYDDLPGGPRRTITLVRYLVFQISGALRGFDTTSRKYLITVRNEI